MKKLKFILIIFLIFNFLFAEIWDDMSSLWNPVAEEAKILKKHIINDGGNFIEYDFKNSTAGWLGIYRDAFDFLDLDSGDSIKFYFKGNGSINDLKLQVYDSDGDVFDRKISSITHTNDNWLEIVVPFDSLSCWKDSLGRPFGNGLLDKKRITKLAFAITPGDAGSGSVVIDEIYLYKLNTKEFFLVDSFNFGCLPNEAGGNEGPMSPDSNGDGKGDYDPVIKYDKENSYEGSYALSLNYDFPLGLWCGYWIFLTPQGEDGYRDLSLYTHLKFYVKSDQAGKKFKIELKDDGGIKFVQLTNYISATTTYYQEVLIPLDDFLGLNKQKVKQINFVFDQIPTEGIVYIDYIHFISTNTAYSGGIVNTIDNMDLFYKISGWKNYGKDEDKGVTKTTLDNAMGYKNDAIKLNYKFIKYPPDINDWVVVERDWGKNIAPFKAIKFQIKGSGSKDNLEVKIGDKNGTVYFRKFFGITETSNIWQEFVVPFKEFTLFKKGNDWQGKELSYLDLTKIKSVEFIISKKEAKSGSVVIKNLELLSEEKEEIFENQLLSLFKISNTAITKDNKSIKFIFKTRDDAIVKLSIYDLAGNLVYEEESSISKDIESSFEWFGNKKDKNYSVKNGLYLYQLEVSSKGKKQKVTNVIGVMR